MNFSKNQITEIAEGMQSLEYLNSLQNLSMNFSNNPIQVLEGFENLKNKQGITDLSMDFSHC